MEQETRHQMCVEARYDGKMQCAKWEKKESERECLQELVSRDSRLYSADWAQMTRRMNLLGSETKMTNDYADKCDEEEEGEDHSEEVWEGEME